MKRLAFCAAALLVAFSLSACQKQQFESGTVSARGPITNADVTESAPNNTFESFSVPDFATESSESSGENKPIGLSPNLTASKSDETSSATEDKDESSSKSEDKSEVSSKTEDKDEGSSQSADKDESKSSDTSSGEVAENGTFVYEGVTIDLPAGYYIQSDSDNVITTVPEDYPYVNQNVTFTMSEGKSAHITEEDINSMYEGMFDNFSGCKEFNEYTIDGYDAQYFSYDLEMSGIKLEMSQLAIYLDDKSVIITFTSEESEDFSVLKKAADSVRIE